MKLKTIILPLLMMLSLSSCNSKKEVSLTKDNYKTYVSIVPSIKTSSNIQTIELSASSVSPKFEFSSFCYFDIRVDFSYTTDNQETKEAYEYFSLTLDIAGNGKGKKNSFYHTYGLNTKISFLMFYNFHGFIYNYSWFSK